MEENQKDYEQELEKDYEQKVQKDLKKDPSSNRDFIKGILFGLLVAAILVLGATLYLFGTFDSGDKGATDRLTSAKTALKIRALAGMIDDTYLYDVDEDTLETWMFKGIAAGLEDKYAAYYSKEEMEQITQQNNGEYKGIGITFEQRENGDLVIIKVSEDSPAERAGLAAEDILRAIGGKEVTGMDMNSAAALVSKEKDSVDITYERDGELTSVEVAIEKIKTAPVKGEMVDDEIGMITIPEFDSVTVEQFEDCLRELKEQGMTKLVIDLRGNPGGLLDSVTRILDDLLPEGVIVSTQDKNGKGEEIRSDDEKMFDGPLAVLVNSDSASASEVFSGAIQDYELGPIIGSQTYGKGVVQRTFELSDGSAFKLTCEKYYTPKMQDIDGKGITPDIEASDEEALDKAVEYLKEK